MWVITPFLLEASESYRWNISPLPSFFEGLSLTWLFPLCFLSFLLVLPPGYTLRMFCIAFTTKMPGQMKKTCYAQSGQVRVIRKKMVDIMTEEASSEDLKGLINKL